MKYYYDLHMHSALSPCGDNDMTPNNMINMAVLKGLDIIAVSDHNSCRNAAAVMEAGQKAGIIVVPGIEVESADTYTPCVLISGAPKKWRSALPKKCRPSGTGRRYSESS